MTTHTHVEQEIEQLWYLDSGANNHIIFELENLTLQQQPYHGNDKVTVGNGGGSLITDIDDIIVTINTSSSIDALISKLSSEFAVEDLGPLSYFLGIQVTNTANGLHLHQVKYAVDLLHHMKMAGAKPAPTPCTLGGKLSDAKRVLRYLKGTLYLGLQFSKGSLKLNGFCDWEGSSDDQKSTSGYCVYLGSCLISWAVKKQPVLLRDKLMVCDHPITLKGTVRDSDQDQTNSEITVGPTYSSDKQTI
ncbi:hypothetical protein F2P56_008632 [Juglans regia]|uniref:Reverse transcriptase Ty1/copia-type domain-containing protein n=1 Tax=Juglans regia TaxID=51240 RepID=A0A833XUY3_JUGRE|nr:hypothetical protein F2P56_008632 [Juglans regia]